MCYKNKVIHCISELYKGGKQGQTAHNTATERQPDKEKQRQIRTQTNTDKQTHRRTAKHRQTFREEGCHRFVYLHIRVSSIFLYEASLILVFNKGKAIDLDKVKRYQILKLAQPDIQPPRCVIFGIRPGIKFSDTGHKLFDLSPKLDIRWPRLQDIRLI